MQEQDLINNPSHYRSDASGVECIEITQNMPFCMGNCYKYIHRAPFKGTTMQDLQKARYYADRALQLRQFLLPDEKAKIDFVVGFQNGERKTLMSAFAECTNETGFEKLLETLTTQIDVLQSARKKQIDGVLSSQAGLNWVYRGGADMPTYRKLFSYQHFYHTQDKKIWSNGDFHILDGVTDELIDEYLYNNFIKSIPHVLPNNHFDLPSLQSSNIGGKIVVVNRVNGYKGIVPVSLIELTDTNRSYYVHDLHLQLFVSKFGLDLTFYLLKDEAMIAAFAGEQCVGCISLIDSKIVVEKSSLA